MDLVNTYTNVSQADMDNMQLTIDYQRRGYNQVTITEIDTTTIPQVAAGSMVEVGGSLYEADSNESISGSASSGTNYIYLVPGTSIVTPTWTTAAPTWSDAKQGWYGTGGSASYRYILSLEYDGASAYSNKEYLLKPISYHDSPYDYPHLLTTMNSNQTVGPSAEIIEFDSVVLDTHSGFNTGTYTYVVPEDGYYLLNFKNNVYPDTSTGDRYNSIFYINSSASGEGRVHVFSDATGTSGIITCQLIATRLLAKDDTVQVQGDTTSNTYTVLSGTASCLFSVDRLF